LDLSHGIGFQYLLAVINSQDLGLDSNSVYRTGSDGWRLVIKAEVMDERAWPDGRPLHNEVAELNAQVVVLTRRLDKRMKAGKRQAARAGFESLSTGR